MIVENLTIFSDNFQIENADDDDPLIEFLTRFFSKVESLQIHRYCDAYFPEHVTLAVSDRLLNAALALGTRRFASNVDCCSITASGMFHFLTGPAMTDPQLTQRSLDMNLVNCGDDALAELVAKLFEVINR